ncbi:hypothetical protein [Georgenia sp. SUBG003]|uniref:hypothetical protein n=1 Tax=Georgenia sp. SUBG003 TaxID=1497974 RepID=UPI0005B82FAD
MSVGGNLSLSALKGYLRGPFLNSRLERRAVDDVVRDVRVKTSGPAAPIGSLSGGNQQKVVIGRALMTTPTSCSWTSRPAVSTSAPRPTSSS